MTLKKYLNISDDLIGVVNNVHQTTLDKNNPRVEDYTTDQLKEFVEKYQDDLQMSNYLTSINVKNPQQLTKWIREQVRNKKNRSYLPTNENNKQVNQDTPDQHTCALHVKHSQFGEGTTINGQHALPGINGVAWYDIMFENEIRKRVPTSELEVITERTHKNHNRK